MKPARQVTVGRNTASAATERRLRSGAWRSLVIAAPFIALTGVSIAALLQFV